MIGCNFDSGVISRKDIIKISGGFLTQKEVNQVSLIALEPLYQSLEILEL